MASNWIHFLITIIFFIHLRSYSSLPLIMAPKIFRLLTKENVIVLPLSQEPFLLEIKVQDKILYTKYFQKPSKEPFALPIMLDQNVTTGQAKLSVIDRNGDENSSNIYITGDTGFGFIQTDKPIYTPKETVKIRLMRLNDDLKPMVDKVKLQIKNPHKIVMDEVIFEEPQIGSYFIDYSFKIPPDPIKNKWTVVMSYGPEFSASTNVTFEVKEYILPPFEVKLHSLPYITPVTPVINGSVSVSYLNGNPVSGRVRFKFKVRDPSNHTIGIGQTDELELVKGFTTYQFSSDELTESGVVFDRVLGGNLIIEATVIETATRRKVKRVDSSTHFVSSPYKVSFANSFREFRPEHNVRLSAEILNVAGHPSPGVKVKMTVFGVRRVQKNLTSDDLGRVTFDYATNSREKRIIVEVTTADPSIGNDEQAYGRFIVERYNVTTCILTIENKRDRFKVGEKFENSVLFEGSTFIFSHAYYMILVRGRIDSLERIPDNDRFSFIIQPHMAPSFRLVVLSYRYDRIVSDSILVHVDNTECGLNLTYLNSQGVPKRNIEPGENGTLVIKTSNGGHVSIIGVDEAVYLLRDKNVLSRQGLRKRFNAKDTGCGPGGGISPTDVILNSGLVITGMELESRGSNCDPVERGKKRFGRSTRSRLTGTRPSSSDESESTKAYLVQCCRLGKIQSKLQLTCEQRQAILMRSVTNAKCGARFLECCVRAALPNQLKTTGFDMGIRVRTKGVALTQAVSIGEEEAIEEITLVRDDFRETWLFDIVSIDKAASNVPYQYPVTAPHSITSWQINALSVSPVSGLCLMDEPLRLISSRDLYMRVDLPYSVVVNEQIEMLVTIFNNGPARKKVNLFMYGVDGVCSEADSGQKTERRLITIEAGSVHTEGFALSPIRTGEFRIQIDALAHGSSDIVIKTLHVVPQGITVVDNYNVQLDPRNLQQRKKRSIKHENLVDSIDPDKGEQKTRIDLVPRTRSKLIVPDSEECLLSAIADRLGSTVETSLANLDHLIQKPTGCGEQNAIRMAPTLFTIDYLNATGRLRPDQQVTGLKYIKLGYENQLMFRKLDGSFSTFEKRSGSLWLTAFVLKILCKASPYLGASLDPEVILGAIDFIVDKQSSSPAGSWKEFHPVLHKSALGGLNGIVPMTAFTYNSVKTCSKLENIAYPRNLLKRRDKALKHAESYLCSKLTSELAKGDPYHIALLAYSLSKGPTCLTASGDLRKQVLTRLRELSEYSPNENRMYWNTTAPVETTGYVLLTLVNLKEFRRNEMQATINYLESQRSYTGAFDATQDTIVALEALSEYAKSQFNSTDINLICNITSGRFRKSIEFHEDNAQIMRTFEMNNECDHIDMVTRGTGLGSVRVKYKYNILEPTEKLCGFELDVNVTDELKFDADEGDDVDLGDLFNITMLAQIGVLTERVIDVTPESVNNQPANERPPSPLSQNNLGPPYSSSGYNEADVRLIGTSKLTNRLNVCVKRYGSQDAGMTILEVGILSGFVADENDLIKIKKSKPFVSSYEKTARSIIFYLEEVLHDKTYCLSFKIYQETKVANLQSAMVKVYDYYKKGEVCSQLYHSTRRTDYLKKICNSSLCQCTARWICPLNDNLLEVGEIGSINMIRAREKFKKLICSQEYNFVWLGRFIKAQEKESLYILDFKIGLVLKGDQHPGHDYTFSMDRNCFDTSLIKGTWNERFLVMGRSRDGIQIHLDSRSILYDLDDNSGEARVHNPIKRVVDDYKLSHSASNLAC